MLLLAAALFSNKIDDKRDFVKGDTHNVPGTLDYLAIHGLTLRRLSTSGYWFSYKIYIPPQDAF